MRDSTDPGCHIRLDSCRPSSARTAERKPVKRGMSSARREREFSPRARPKAEHLMMSLRIDSSGQEQVESPRVSRRARYLSEHWVGARRLRCPSGCPYSSDCRALLVLLVKGKDGMKRLAPLPRGGPDWAPHNIYAVKAARRGGQPWSILASTCTRIKARSAS